MMFDNFFWGGGFRVLFTLTFCLVLGIILFVLISSVRQWGKNNRSPKLTVNAAIVDKRTHISHHHHNADMHAMHTSTHTSYYVTFQVESGDRMELQVDCREFGLLIVGDRGRLHFQGTRYLGFDRA